MQPFLPAGFPWRRAENAKQEAEAAQAQANSLESVVDDAHLDSAAIYKDVVRDGRVPVEVRFIYAWSLLEKDMRETAHEYRGDDLAGLPLGRLIRTYSEIKNLSGRDEEQLRSLLRTRNAMVHGGRVHLSEPEAESAIKRIGTLLDIVDG